MASNIDETKPVQGNATTASMRANFAAAKAEILQAQADILLAAAAAALASGNADQALLDAAAAAAAAAAAQADATSALNEAAIALAAAQLAGFHFTMLQADFVGNNATGVQPFFPAGQNTFTLQPYSTYLIEGHISMRRAAGAVSHTTGVSFGGAPDIAAIRYACACRYGARAAATPVRPYTAEYYGLALGTNQIVQLAATTVNSKTLDFSGAIVTALGGPFIPQFQYSAAPGGAPTIERGSYFKMTLVGDDAAVVVGDWA